MNHLLVALLVLAHAAHAGGNCHLTSWGFTPLTELGLGTFLGATGGLYAAGSNEIPAGHGEDGLNQAAAIQPRAPNGTPHPDGKIGVICLGMSNANNIFEVLADLLPTASNVVVINAAFGGVHAGAWANAGNSVWTNSVPIRLADAGLTAEQIQVVLHYHGMAHSLYPPQPWPDTPQDFQIFCEQIATNAFSAFPNTRLMFWTSREYGGYATTVNNPEPYAYYAGFATKWMIEKQIQGDPGLNWNPELGPVTTSWMAWGPYTWADGLKVRDDGLFYECRDFQNDGTHPRTRGRTKIADQWASFLYSSPYTTNWLIPPGNIPPMVKLISPPENVVLNARGTVALEVYARDLDGEVASVDFYASNTWIGTSSQFPFDFFWENAPTGMIPIQAVATDDLGLSTTSRTAILLLTDQPLSTNQTLIASDNFESGDFVGGFGFQQQGWQVFGPADVTTTNAPPEGLWQARLRGGAAIQRSLGMAGGTTNATLTFFWRGNIPSGYVFTVEAMNPGTNDLLVATNSLIHVTNISLSLDVALPATNLFLRYRLDGPGSSGQILIDDIRISVEGGSAQDLMVSVPIEQHPVLLLRWPTLAGVTYEAVGTPDLETWTPFYVTTAEEHSDAVVFRPMTNTFKAYGIRGNLD